MKTLLLGRLVMTLSTVPLALALGAVPPASADANTRVVSLPIRKAVLSLRVADETRSGYDRAKFVHWIDADGDCRDTRDEVLAAESLVAVEGCDIQSGEWRSYYDGDTTKDSTGFDIDHLVPLAEAWDSGARRWTPGTRKRFANDLHDPRTLVAVSASSNRTKGDRDPAEWMPELAGCRYVRQWVAVKIRWRLKVDATEKQFLTDRAGACTNVTITVRKATVHKSS